MYKYCENDSPSLNSDEINNYWDTLKPTRLDLMEIEKEIRSHPNCHKILRSTGYKANGMFCDNGMEVREKKGTGFKNHYEYLACYYKRKMMWSKESPFGIFLRNLDVIAKIQNKLFMHAGLRLDIARNYQTIQEINEQARNILKNVKDVYQTDLLGPDGVVWTRCIYILIIDYPECTHELKKSLECRSAMEGCLQLEKVLKKFGADRMIVGHTPDNKNFGDKVRIYSTCPDSKYKNQFYVIDTMISRYMIGGNFNGNIYSLKIEGETLEEI